MFSYGLVKRRGNRSENRLQTAMDMGLTTVRYGFSFAVVQSMVCLNKHLKCVSTICE